MWDDAKRGCVSDNNVDHHTSRDRCVRGSKDPHIRSQELQSHCSSICTAFSRKGQATMPPPTQDTQAKHLPIIGRDVLLRSAAHSMQDSELGISQPSHKSRMPRYVSGVSSQVGVELAVRVTIKFKALQAAICMPFVGIVEALHDRWSA